jgi:hypothetical protein
MRCASCSLKSAFLFLHALRELFPEVCILLFFLCCYSARVFIYYSAFFFMYKSIFVASECIFLLQLTVRRDSLKVCVFLCMHVIDITGRFCRVQSKIVASVIDITNRFLVLFTSKISIAVLKG